MQKKDIVAALPQVNNPSGFLLMTPAMVARIDPRIATCIKKAGCQNVAQFLRIGRTHRLKVNGYAAMSEELLREIGKKYGFDIEHNKVPNNLIKQESIKIEISYIIYRLGRQTGFKKRTIEFASLDRMLTFFIIFSALQSRVITDETVQSIVAQKSKGLNLPAWIKPKKDHSLIITKIRTL